ncbi:LOW QUALITY PROTEIN: uncharacterized protein LOC124620147 [Schistocerca americana]|uniref:LOW QUALITY PROTEIN: uncharacterized protein LOC124620147 n=1 Tax=Schistocerca americana TaxID=7009 RepID=UPI001F4F2C94|nr:LOW QUALITY PROTEIN: uncharacterized protein LOC124620147 [Schistocerca americana]
MHCVKARSRVKGNEVDTLGDKPWPALLPRSLGPAVGGVGVGVAVGVGGTPRRPRSEKRPIPDDQKDEKYFERRKRNNQAAKKSRDARKVREDQIALRAAMLEHENAVLRAQLVTLREEAHSLRHLLAAASAPGILSRARPSLRKRQLLHIVTALTPREHLTGSAAKSTSRLAARCPLPALQRKAVDHYSTCNL